MKKQYKTVIHTYFSDYVRWLLLVSFLFIVTLVTGVYFNEIDKFFWIVPVLFIIIYLSSISLLILYCKVKKDLKATNIEKITIRAFEIKDDKNFSFKKRGGAIVGKKKYNIIDENNNIYLISASNNKDWFTGIYPHPTFSLEIEVLKVSRLVLQMRVIENEETLKEPSKHQHNIKQFKKVFSQYF